LTLIPSLEFAEMVVGVKDPPPDSKKSKLASLASPPQRQPADAQFLGSGLF